MMYFISPKERGLYRQRHHLAHFFAQPIVTHLPQSAQTVTYLGWARKPSGLRAVALANKQQQAFCLLEDGFVRSIGLGKDAPALSIVQDSQGIYYDATAPSALETLIQQPLDEAQQQRARALVALWRTSRVSKYNHLREYSGQLPQNYVLVVDQTLGDLSIQYGQADIHAFQRMLKQAMRLYPEHTILLKVHPDVLAGYKQGHFDLSQLQALPKVQIMAEAVHPVRLIEQAQAVFVVTSQMGFEALLWGKKVYTFGMPFYAGYGLTEDELPAPTRRQKATLEQLVYAVLVQYCRYLNPETLQRCSAEWLIRWIGEQRLWRQQFPETVWAVGFSRWKKKILQQFLQGSSVTFFSNMKSLWAQLAHSSLSAKPTVLVWGREKKIDERCKFVHVEDGFLRSVGLGADLVRPLSWVFDQTGIYYDATQVSDLELILQHQQFDEPLLQRAAALRTRLIDARLTKYNVGQDIQWQRPNSAKSVILVPGQVESDASIRYGSVVIKQNMQLLKTVREQNPDAYIVYKPHPDVVAGLRAKGENEDQARQWCDEIVREVSITALFQQVDAVHVLTSLAGFEALIRGLDVVTYGQPFYAGWGLTTDYYPPARRGRKLSLEALIAGALILYPRYVHPVSGAFTTPESVLSVLEKQKQQAVPTLPKWRKLIRPVLGRLVAWKRKYL